MSHASGVCSPRFATVFYDLDGTLVDSRPGIEASLRVAFGAHLPGVAPPPLGAALGLPLKLMLRAALPAGCDERALSAVALTFAGHYDVEGWRLSRPYPGVPGALADLAAAGVRQVVLTNKRLCPATAILAANGLAPHIERLYTPDSASPPFDDKAAMARAAQVQCAALSDSLLVIGDSADDLLMADACGATFAAAAYGYGDATSELSARAVAGRGGSTPAAPFVLQTAGEITGLVLPERSKGGA